MQPQYGGALARPFTTHHNTLDLDLYLRVAPELYLKRLLVGGMGRVYELNRNFRNEGVSTQHNPEFTMLEFYVAYWDYRRMMEFVEELLALTVKAVLGAPDFEYQGNMVSMQRPWKRMKFADALMEILEARGVIVVIEAEHLCMTMRGVKKGGARTITSAVRGIMHNPATRSEAMSLIRGTR